jgi:excinuclease ABC subunit C
MQAASDALNFEEAAKYRDQIKHLTTIQIKQNIDINDLFNGDVIGIYQNKNLVVVQIFFFRFGKNFGTKSIFIKQSYPQTIEENLNTFLNQFYTENEPPEHIVLSHEPTDFSLLKEAFKQQYTKSIKWEIPKTGIKKELIDQTLQNAQQSLEQKLLSSDSLTQIFEELKKHISTPKNSRKNRNL